MAMRWWHAIIAADTVRISRTRAFVGAFLALVAALVVFARSESRPLPPAAGRADVDRIFAQWDRKDSPGCALALFKDGAIQYERGYGMADLEHDVAITPDTVFYVGSVSKQFTAFAAALAIQQGRLGPNDSIRKYLPELPEYAGTITIQQLVHHTSGLRDFYALLSIAGRREDALFDNAAILRLAAKQRALNFPPGTEYLYSNTGYALLAIIIGRATGTSFGSFVETNIFRPLGMTASRVGDDAARIVKERAFGYSRAPGGELRLDTPGGERVGAGGVFTDVRDLLKWDENFYDARVGGRSVIDQVQAPGTLSDGRPLAYAWGLMLGTYRGLKIVEHGGSLGGYRAHLMRFPDRHVSIACLCNLSSIAPGALARQVADVALAAQFAEPEPAGQQASGAGASPSGGRGEGARDTGAPRPVVSATDYAGTYVSDELGTTVAVSVKNGQLIAQREDDSTPAALQPSAAAGQFQFHGMVVRFVRAANGKIDALVVDAGRVRDIRFVRRQAGR